jgi:hypothetical protein
MTNSSEGNDQGTLTAPQQQKVESLGQKLELDHASLMIDIGLGLILLTGAIAYAYFTLWVLPG